MTVAEAQAAAAEEDSRTTRPQDDPVSPVADASELTVANAGSLSGERNGDVVQLYLPTAKARSGDWVSVFLFPGATTTGWVQVAEDNSVSLDVSGLGSGTYQLAVGDRDNGLLGWAQLEITSRPSADPDAGALTSGSEVRSDLLAPGDWLLVSAGGLLMLGAASCLVLARPTGGPRRP